MRAPGSDDPGPGPRTSWLRHRRGIVIGVVVAAIVAVAIVVTIRSGERDQVATPPAGSAASTAPAPTGPAAELVRLLRRGASLDFDARYTSAGSAPSTAHLWRRPPLARLDTQSGSGDTASTSAQIVTSGGPVACTQAGRGPWSCAPKPGLDVAEVGVIPPSVVAALSAVHVTARDDTVIGLAVRCFTIAAGPGASADVCVTSSGVPARLASGDTRLDLVSLSLSRPPDSVFVAPAPVGG
ncbi:MAG: hypothetical protein ABR511_09020 [Acidimicrobiales bacterium]